MTDTDQRVPALDGLRGLAVTGVVAYHAGFPWARGGFLGVSAFFTLSGFLITGLLVDEAASSPTGRGVRLGAFWARRARRLLPAALVALAWVVVFGATVADGDQVRALRGDVLSALGHVANWRFVTSGRSYEAAFGSPSPVLHFWSLAVEAQFYVVFPLVVAATLAWTGRRGLTVACGALALASVAATWQLAGGTATDPARAYFGTDTRAAELLVGALAALWWRRRPAPTVPGVAGAGALLALGVAWLTAAPGSGWLYEGGFALLAMAAAAVILSAHDGRSAVARVLSWAPLRCAGLVSYGLYLYHWPVFLWLDARRTGITSVGLLFLVRLAVVVPLAVVSYVAVERPIRVARLGRRAAPAVAVAAAVAILVGVVVVADESAPPTYDFAAPREAAHAPASPADPGAVRVLVVGDSIAAVLARGLERWGAETGRLVVSDATRNGCGLVRGGSWWFEGRRLDVAPGCDDWPARWRGQVADFGPDVVLVHSGPWDIEERRLPGWAGYESLGEPRFDANLVAEYREAASWFAATGIPVAWASPPCFGSFVPSSDPLHDPEAVRRIGTELLPAALAGVDGDLRVVDLFSKVCPEGRFTEQLGGATGTRPDGVHFVPATADWLAAWLGPQLEDQARAS